MCPVRAPMLGFEKYKIEAGISTTSALFMSFYFTCFMAIFGSLTPFLGKKGQVLKNADFTACSIDDDSTRFWSFSILQK